MKGDWLGRVAEFLSAFLKDDLYGRPNRNSVSLVIFGFHLRESNLAKTICQCRIDW